MPTIAVDPSTLAVNTLSDDNRYVVLQVSGRNTWTLRSSVQGDELTDAEETFLHSLIPETPPAYDPMLSYAVGDQTVVGRKVMTCIAPTTGAFNASHWQSSGLPLGAIADITGDVAGEKSFSGRSILRAMITHDSQQGAIKYYTNNTLVDYGTGASCSMFAISTITGKIYKARVASVSDRTKDPSVNTTEWQVYGEGAGGAGPIQPSHEYVTNAEGYAAVSVTIDGVLTELYLTTGSFTTDATPTVSELLSSNWKYRDQIHIPNVKASMFYPAGFLVSDGQRPAAIYAAVADITTHATDFATDLTNTAKWTLKGGGGSMGNVRAWAADTRVEPDELRRRVIGGVSFVLRNTSALARTTGAAGSWSGTTQTEPGNWVCCGQEGQSDFVAGEWYVPGCRVSKGGSEWIRTAPSASESAWDATKWKLVDVPFLLREEITGSKLMENYTEYIGNSAADSTLEIPGAVTTNAMHRIEFINNNGKKYTFTLKTNTDKLNGTVNGTVVSSKVGERLIFTCTKSGEWRWTGRLTFNVTRDTQAATLTGGVGVPGGENCVVHLPLAAGKRLGLITTVPAGVACTVLSRRDILLDVAVVQVTMPQADVDLTFTQVDDSQDFNVSWDVGQIYAIGSAAPQTNAELPMSGGTYSRAAYPELYGLIASNKWKFATFNSTTEQFTLFNLNSGATGGAGYFLGGLGGNTVGTRQDDATAVNGLSVTHSNNNINTRIGVDGGGANGVFSDGVGLTHVVSSSDTETRPYTARVLWVVKARPTPVAVESGGTFNLVSTDVPLRTVAAVAPGGNLVNGVSSMQVGQGYGAMIRIPLTADRQIDTATASTGTVTIIDRERGIVWAVPAAGDMTITVTERALRVAVTVTGASGTINGAANFMATIGQPNDFIVDLPAGQRLDACGSTTGVVTIINPLSGYVRLNGVTAATVLTPTITAAATYNGLQKAGECTTNINGTVAGVTLTYSTVLRDGDLIQFNVDYANSSAQSHALWFRVEAGKTYRAPAWPASDHLVEIVFPATLTASVTYKHGSGNTSCAHRKSIVWRDAANGFVIPTGTTTLQPRIISGSVTGTAFEGYTTPHRITLPANEELVTVAVNSGAVSRVNDRAGLIAITPGATDIVVSHTTRIWQRVLTAVNNTGGVAINVNGAASLNFDVTGPVSVSVPVPAGQTVSAVAVTNGTLVSNNGTGAITVQPNGVGNIVLTITYAVVARSIFGVANGGTFITLGSIAVGLSAGGNRSVQVRSASGTINIRYHTWLAWDSAPEWGTINGLTTSSTTYLNGNYHFPGAGNSQQAIIEDTTNSRRYRVHLVIGFGYNNNLIWIEELT